MRAALILTFLTATVPLAFADDLTTTKPIGYTWIVSGCDSWSCAAAVLAQANGDPNTLVLPTSNTEFPWIVLRRVMSGAIYVPPDEHFDIETFDQIGDAAARWAAIDSARIPILVTTTADSKLVVSMKSPPSKQRAVGGHH